MLLALTQDTPLVLHVHVCIVGEYSGHPVCVILVLLLLFFLAVLLSPGSNIFNYREVHPPWYPAIASLTSCNKYSSPFCFAAKHYGKTLETVN